MSDNYGTVPGTVPVPYFRTISIFTTAERRSFGKGKFLVDKLSAKNRLILYTFVPYRTVRYGTLPTSIFNNSQTWVKRVK